MERMPRLGTTARLESIQFQTEDTFFQDDAPLVFDVSIQSIEYTGKARLSLTLFRGDGTAIGSCFSDESMQLEKGTTTDTTVQLDDLRLAPGFYYFGVSVGTGNNHTGFRDFDSVTDVLHFEIARPTLEGGGVAAWNRGWGAIRLPSPVIKQANTHGSGR